MCRTFDRYVIIVIGPPNDYNDVSVESPAHHLGHSKTEIERKFEFFSGLEIVCLLHLIKEGELFKVIIL